MVDKIALILGISSSDLFIENNSPENIKEKFNKEFSKSLESELLSRIKKDVEDVCKLL